MYYIYFIPVLSLSYRTVTARVRCIFQAAHASEDLLGASISIVELLLSGCLAVWLHLVLSFPACACLARWRRGKARWTKARGVPAAYILGVHIRFTSYVCVPAGELRNFMFGCFAFRRFINSCSVRVDRTAFVTQVKYL